MASALLLIDLQNDFFSNGALSIPQAEEVIPIALQLIAMAHNMSIPIIATQDWHPVHHGSFASQSGGEIGDTGKLAGIPQIWWPDHCIQNSPGAAFHPLLPSQSFDFIVYKGTNPLIDSYSAFFDNHKRISTPLHNWLQQHHIKNLYIMGLATDYCVQYSVLDALQLGYQVTVVTEGCQGVNLSPNDSQKAQQTMSQAGAMLCRLGELIIC